MDSCHDLFPSAFYNSHPDAATNFVVNKSRSNLTEHQYQEILASVSDLTAIELTDAWENETIINIKDNTTTVRQVIDPEKSPNCSYGNISITIPANDSAVSSSESEYIKCVLTTTPEDETVVDLYDYATGTSVFQTNSSCFPFYITMGMPSNWNGTFNFTETGNEDGNINTMATVNVSDDGILYPVCTFYDLSLDS